MCRVMHNELRYFLLYILEALLAHCGFAAGLMEELSSRHFVEGPAPSLPWQLLVVPEGFGKEGSQF